MACHDNNAFGPVSTCRPFDLTQLFEEAIFGIGVSSLFAIIAAVRIFHLRATPPKPKADDDGLLYLNLPLWLALGGISLAVLVNWCLRTHLATVATIPAAVLDVVIVVLLALTTSQESIKSDRPPLVASSYLSLSSLFDIARIRTYWLLPHLRIVASLYSGQSALKLLTLGFLLYRHSVRYRHLRGKDFAPEQYAGLFGLGLWSWLNNFLVYGYRRGIATLNDLDSIDADLLSSKKGSVLATNWQHVPGKHALLKAILVSLKPAVVAPVLPRLAQIFFTYMQPLLLTRSIQYAETAVPEKNIGYALIGAYGLTYIGYAVSSAQYWRYVNRVTAKIRAVLVTELFQKTETLAADQAANTDSITLMSTDVERISKGIKFAHEIWATIIETAIALYLLQRQVGAIAVVPVGVALACVSASSWTAGVAGGRQKVWLESLQTRLQFTFPVVSAIREMRMLGLTKHIHTTVSILRKNEVNAARWFRHIIVISFVLAYATLTISPSILFGILAYPAGSEGRTFDASRVFTSLSLINLLATPLITFLQSLPSLASAVANFTRIQVFLQAEPQHDYRQGGHSASMGRLVDKEASLGDIKLQEKPAKGVDAEDTPAVQFRGATFKHCLPHVELTLHRGTFTAIIGPSGSGKSSLLRAMLGELSPAAGTIYVSARKIAFSGQTPWIMNSTVRDNILGYDDSPFDEAFLAEVFRACDLEVDFPNSELGRLCATGSKGANLSGGQRQRVSLARSVYARCPLTVLDDVFSGLDPVTEAKVAEGLFGAQGLLRQGEKTVVLASHSTHSLHLADQIVVLSADGNIAQVGTLDQLLTTNKFVKSAYQNRNNKSVTSGEEERIQAQPPKYEEVTSTPSIQPATLHNTTSAAVYWYYFRSLGVINVFLFFLLGIAFTFTLRFPDVWLSWWASDGASSSSNSQRSTGEYLGVYVGLQMATLVLVALWSWIYLNCAVAQSGIILHRQLLVAVLGAKMQFLIPFDHGVIANYFSQDLQLVDSELPGALINAVAEILSVIAQLILIAIVSVYICTIYPFILITLYLIQRFYLKTSQPLRILDIESKAPLYTQFLETLDGLITIRAFGWHARLRAQNRELLDASQKPFYLMLSVQQWLNLVLNLVVAGLAVVIMGLVMPLRHVIEPAYLGVALSNIMTLGETLRNLVIWWTQLQSSVGAVKRIRDFAASAPLEGHAEEDLDAVTKSNGELSPHGALSFTGVKASYPLSTSTGTGTGTSRPALDGITLDIPAGTKIGICGRSGSGKSTLLSLLFRLLDLDAGSITLDGTDICTVTPERLRSAINAIPQTPFILPGSWRSNLDPTGRYATETEGDADAKLWDALKTVRLDGVIRRQPGGLDAEATGNSLSQGQRQLFCLARALLKTDSSARIVVLDEISSSVDPGTDALMREVVEKEFRDQSVLVVAHRLEWVLKCDIVVVLEKGRIVEMGTPGELVEREGFFKALWRAEREGRDIRVG